MEQTYLPGSRLRSVGSPGDAGAELPAAGSVDYRQHRLLGIDVTPSLGIGTVYVSVASSPTTSMPSTKLRMSAFRSGTVPSCMVACALCLPRMSWIPPLHLLLVSYNTNLFSRSLLVCVSVCQLTTIRVTLGFGSNRRQLTSSPTAHVYLNFWSRLVTDILVWGTAAKDNVAPVRVERAFPAIVFPVIQ